MDCKLDGTFKLLCINPLFDVSMAFLSNLSPFASIRWTLQKIEKICDVPFRITRPVQISRHFGTISGNEASENVYDFVLMLKLGALCQEV